MEEKYYQKVVWGEGMLLTPNHFQQADRYHDRNLAQRCRAMRIHDQGLCSLTLDAAAIAGGEFVLTQVSAVLPNGMLVNAPDFDPLPSPRAIKGAFPADRSSLGVYLGIVSVPEGSAVARHETESGADSVPYHIHNEKLKDEISGETPRDLQVARKRLKILFETEARDTLDCLQIAELKRKPTGEFEVAPRYIPTCQFIEAAPRLITILREILEAMNRKAEDLSAKRRQRSQGLVEFTTSEAGHFWFLHALNAHIPLVAHYFQQQKSHPEAVYCELAKLAGELYSFAGSGHPKDLPPYDHADLSTPFNKLEALIKENLGEALPTRCEAIPLEDKTSFWLARPNSEQLTTSRLYLAAMSDLSPEQMANELPMKSKITSSDMISFLIGHAVPGVKLRHLQAVPSEIPVQPGRRYFELVAEGDHWDAVSKTKTLAIYLPRPEFPRVKLELMAVKE